MRKISDYVNDYRFEFGDGGSYVPTERDKAMLEDAIEGYLADAEHEDGCPSGDFGPCDCRTFALPRPQGEAP